MSVSVSTTNVRASLDGNVFTITLSSDDGRNYVTHRAMLGFIEALRRAEEARALILHVKSSGVDFCLGRKQGESVPDVSRTESLKLILKANDALHNFSGVSIAEVQGRAYGFGAGLALQCDLTVADNEATFSFDEIDFGLAPLIVAEYLPKYIGNKRAQAMVLTGAEISAAAAATWGFVTHVSPSGQASNEAESLIDRLLSLEPGALRLLKRYGQDLRDGGLNSPRLQAVERLAEWLEADRPHDPT